MQEYRLVGGITYDFKKLYDIFSIRLVCAQSLREDRVGAERVVRDFGRFTLPFEYYDELVFTSKDKEYAQAQVDKIIDKLI